MSDIKKYPVRINKPSIAMVNKYSDYLSQLIADGDETVEWNRLKINGVYVPGKVDISYNISNIIQKDKAKSWTGEDVTYLGKKATSVSVKVQMNGYDYTIFNDLIVPLLEIKSSTGKRQNVLRLENPLLRVAQLDKFLIESISFATPKTGTTEVSMTFVEWSLDFNPTDTSKPNITAVASTSSIAAAAVSGNNDPLVPPTLANSSHKPEDNYGR